MTSFACLILSIIKFSDTANALTIFENPQSRAAIATVLGIVDGTCQATVVAFLTGHCSVIEVSIVAGTLR